MTQMIENSRKLVPLNKAEPPIRLYKGKVMHARLKPVLHRFSYKMTSMLIDLDRLEEADRQFRFFSINKRNLFSFNETDFGARDGSSLRLHVNRLLKEAGLEAPSHVSLLCYPKVLGNGFNPLSIYFCRNADRSLCALIYEVRNTFGEHHTYVEPVLEKHRSEAGIRQTTPKQFYVSPFMDMQMAYRFRIAPPTDKVAIRILETDEEGPILSATFFGREMQTGPASLLITALQSLGLTWKVVAGIHYEALKLWLKGMKIRPRKPHEKAHSFPRVDEDAPSQGVLSGRS